MTTAAMTTALALTANDQFKQSPSAYSRHFEGQTVNAQAVETARGQWKEELENVWGGAGGWVHRLADWMQAALVPVIVGSATTLAIPVVGELIEGFELAVYAGLSVLKGLVRTSAENLAIDKAGGTEADHGGVARTIGNSLKSAIPFFDIG